MSHFSLIVIGKDVKKQLDPYIEEGFAEEYRSFESIEEQAIEEYNNKDINVVELADGTVCNEFEQRFQVKKDKDSFLCETVYPKDAILRQGKYKEIYPTLESYILAVYSLSKRDEEAGAYGYWVNANAKYDYCVEGGRWSGFFKAKSDVKGLKAPKSKDILFGHEPKKGWVNSISLRDIDINGMRDEAAKDANITYDELEKVLNGRELPSWNETRNKHGKNIEAARSEYSSNETVKDLNKARFFTLEDLTETFGKNREEYVERCKLQVMVPFAVVKEGQWYEKGKMGWFGTSTDKMTQDEWNKQFWEMIETLDPETELTIVDCHI